MNFRVHRNEIIDIITNIVKEVGIAKIITDYKEDIERIELYNDIIKPIQNTRYIYVDDDNTLDNGYRIYLRIVDNKYIFTEAFYYYKNNKFSPKYSLYYGDYLRYAVDVELINRDYRINSIILKKGDVIYCEDGWDKLLYSNGLDKNKKRTPIEYLELDNDESEIGNEELQYDSGEELEDW